MREGSEEEDEFFEIFKKEENYLQVTSCNNRWVSHRHVTLARGRGGGGEGRGGVYAESQTRRRTRRTSFGFDELGQHKRLDPLNHLVARTFLLPVAVRCRKTAVCAARYHVDVGRKLQARQDLVPQRLPPRLP